MSLTTPLMLSRCDHCHSLFLPRPAPCAKCGSREVSSVAIDPVGVVLAATQLENPPAGWKAPHRLALVELVESVRLLATVDGELPSIGARVTLRQEPTHFVARRMES